MSIATATETHTISSLAIPLINPATVQAVQTALREAGPRGKVHYYVSTKLVHKYETAVKIRGFEQTIDEPPTLGGTDLGPSPVEVVLAALGACQEIVYSTYAALLGVKIEKLEIKVHGLLDARGFYNVADVPAGFESVDYEVNLESSSPADEVRKLIDTVNNHCPVLDILKRPLPVSTKVNVNGQTL